MSDLTIPNFSKDLQTRLGRRAARKGRSAQAEAREILRKAVKDEPQAACGGSKRKSHKNLAAEIRAIVERHGGHDASDMPPRHPPPEPEPSNSGK